MKPITEYVELNDTIPIRVSVFETITLNHPFHYHEKEYELTLTIGSSGLRIVGDNINRFDELDLVLLSPGLPHCWLNNPENMKKNGERIKVVAIQFIPEYIGKELLVRQEFSSIVNMFEKANRGLMFNDKTRESTHKKILKLKLEPDFHSYIEILEILHDLSVSNHWQFLTSPDYHYRGNAAESKKFELVYEYIHNHYLDQIRISEVAQLAGMNDSAFSHYFKKRTLRSFTEYITQLRLRHATELLENTKNKVAEICYNSGFNNLANFNRQFKGWKGVTPHQWRKWAISMENEYQKND